MSSLPSVSIGTRRHMEQMRKEGGANWLTLYNQQIQDHQVSGVEGEGVSE